MLSGAGTSNELKEIVLSYHKDGKAKLNHQNVAEVYRLAALYGKIDVMMDIDEQDFHISPIDRTSAIKLILPIAPHPIVMHYLSYPLDETMASELLEFAEKNGIIFSKPAKTLILSYKLSQTKEKAVLPFTQDDDEPSLFKKTQYRRSY